MNLGSGGEGLAFVVQNAGLSEIGSSAEGLGYAGIARSIAVEFDTNQDTLAGDPSDNHIAIKSKGTSANQVDSSADKAFISSVPTSL